MSARVVIAAVATITLCACGGGRSAPHAAGKTWRANASQLLTQLRQDVAATQLVASRADAARALRDPSDLYALLVAYSDLSGCSAMVSATAAPPSVVRVLVRPCRRLEDAAARFSRAEARNDPVLLLVATQEARRSDGALVRAALAVHY